MIGFISIFYFIFFAFVFEFCYDGCFFFCFFVSVCIVCIFFYIYIMNLVLRSI